MMTVAEVGTLAPAIDWPAYLRVQGAPDVTKLNVSQPEFMKAVETELTHEPVDDLKGVSAVSPGDGGGAVRWRTRLSRRSSTSSRKTLRGVPAMPPRWKTCTRQVDRNLGEALGQEFVRRTFSADMKAKTQLMTEQIETAMQRRDRGAGLDEPGDEEGGAAEARMRSGTRSGIRIRGGTTRR